MSYSYTIHTIAHISVHFLPRQMITQMNCTYIFQDDQNHSSTLVQHSNYILQSYYDSHNSCIVTFSSQILISFLFISGWNMSETCSWHLFFNLYIVMWEFDFHKPNTSFLSLLSLHVNLPVINDWKSWFSFRSMGTQINIPQTLK